MPYQLNGTSVAPKAARCHIAFQAAMAKCLAKYSEDFED